MLKSLGQSTTEDELKKLIAVADTDGSGDIDFLEFVVLVAHKMKTDNDAGKKTDAIKAAFSMFDQNNSGAIDAAEMRRMMINLGEPMKVNREARAVHMWLYTMWACQHVHTRVDWCPARARARTSSHPPHTRDWRPFRSSCHQSCLARALATF